MNTNEFISELTKQCRALGVKINQNDMKVVITEFTNLLHKNVFEGCEIKIKNFAIFELGKSDRRKLPNGKQCEPKDIIKVRLSDRFKNNS